MVPRFVIALVFGGFLVCSAAVLAAPPLGITTADDWREVDADDRRWHAIGRLNREAGGFCTAVLIGPREALTAAHCLWDRSQGRWLPPASVHFVAGYRRGSYLGHARGERYRLPQDLVMGPRGHPQRAEHDWAVVELELDLAADTGIAPLPMIASAGRVDLVGLPLRRGGYSFDRPHLPVFAEDCSALGVVEGGRLLLHDCDAPLGSSGSPLLVEQDGRFVVVAVQSAVVQSGDEVIGIAVLAERAFRAASPAD